MDLNAVQRYLSGLTLGGNPCPTTNVSQVADGVIVVAACGHFIAIFDRRICTPTPMGMAMCSAHEKELTASDAFGIMRTNVDVKLGDFRGVIDELTTMLATPQGEILKYFRQPVAVPRETPTPQATANPPTKPPAPRPAQAATVLAMAPAGPAALAYSGVITTATTKGRKIQ